MGNVGREVARPFKYAAKTGKTETHETGRHNIGGNIISANSRVKLQAVDNIAVSSFDGHLRGKGLPNAAISYFACLKYVQSGHREHREL